MYHAEIHNEKIKLPWVRSAQNNNTGADLGKLLYQAHKMLISFQHYNRKTKVENIFFVT